MSACKRPLLLVDEEVGSGVQGPARALEAIVLVAAVAAVAALSPRARPHRPGGRTIVARP
jgi:hypothetical protein